MNVSTNAIFGRIFDSALEKAQDGALPTCLDVIL